MICKFCGNEIDDGSDFCFICGQKVEAQQPAPVYAAESVNNVYSQPQQAPAAQPQSVASPVADTYQQAPAQAPVYQQPAAPVAEAAPAKKGKQKAPKDPSVAGKGVKFVAFLFAIIGLILYRKAKKAGYEQKATAILNALMTGVCVKLAILDLVLIKKYVL